MAHPNISVLIDYARDLLPVHERTITETHLQACSECQAALDRFAMIQRFAADEVRFTPPPGLVRSAKQVFGGTPAADEPASIPMQLVFDSFAALAVAGLRAADEAERQLTFQSGPWRLDLAVDKPYGAAGITIVGQLVEAGGAGGGEARIRARQGKRIVTQTASNESGEFVLSFVPRARSTLEIRAWSGGPVLSIPCKYFLE